MIPSKELIDFLYGRFNPSPNQVRELESVVKILLSRVESYDDLDNDIKVNLSKDTFNFLTTTDHTDIIDLIVKQVRDIIQTLNLKRFPLRDQELEYYINYRLYGTPYYDRDEVDRELVKNIASKIKDRLKSEISISESFPSCYTDDILSLQFAILGDTEVPDYHILNKFNDLTEKYNNTFIELVFDKCGIVPHSGRANTVFGELARAAQRIIYRFFNDGDPGFRYFDGSFIDT